MLPYLGVKLLLHIRLQASLVNIAGSLCIVQGLPSSPTPSIEHVGDRAIEP